MSPSEFLHGFGLVCATALGAAAVSFGLRAGIELANWAFGPFNIRINRGDMNIVIHLDESGAASKGSGKP